MIFPSSEAIRSLSADGIEGKKASHRLALSSGLAVSSNLVNSKKWIWRSSVKSARREGFKIMNLDSRSERSSNLKPRMLTPTALGSAENGSPALSEGEKARAR